MCSSDHTAYFRCLSFADDKVRDEVVKLFNRILSAAIDGRYSLVTLTDAVYTSSIVTAAWPGVTVGSQANHFVWDTLRVASASASGTYGAGGESANAQLPTLERHGTYLFEFAWHGIVFTPPPPASSATDATKTPPGGGSK